jgi:large subunit ribosomal protein L15
MSIIAQLRLKPKQNKKKQVARGYAAGGGHNVGHGTHGQSKRGSGKPRPGFAGQDTPYDKRMGKSKGYSRFPKRQKKENSIVNIGKLENFYKKDELVNKRTLLDKGLIKSKKKNVKILGEGELSISLKFKGVLFSESAKKKIKEAGGEILDES